MGKYIKVNKDKTVDVAGLVANELMLKEGYFEYEGEIPNSPFLRYENDLVIIDEERLNIYLEELKEKKKEELEKDYLLANDEDIEFGGYVFQANEKSQQLLVNTLAASGGTLPEGFYWKDKVNQKVEVDYEFLQGLSQAILARNMANFDKLTSLKETLETLTTEEEINNLSWNPVVDNSATDDSVTN